MVMSQLRRERQAFKLLNTMTRSSINTRDVIRNEMSRKPEDLAKDVIEMVDIMYAELLNPKES